MLSEESTCVLVTKPQAHRHTKSHTQQSGICVARYKIFCFKDLSTFQLFNPSTKLSATLKYPIGISLV